MIAIDTRKPARDKWKVLVPEAKDTLHAVEVVNDQFIASYMQDAKSAVRIFDTTGKKVRDFPLPGIGTVGGFTGKQNDTETFYAFTSFTAPRHVSIATTCAPGRARSSASRKLKFNPSPYETKQVFYKSKDGTRVPMFIWSQERGEV